MFSSLAKLMALMVEAGARRLGLFIGNGGRFVREDIFHRALVSQAPSFFFPTREFKTKVVVHSATLSSPSRKTPSSAMAVATVDSSGVASWCSCSTAVARW